MRMRPILTVIVFISSVICGYKLAIQSWGGTVYVYLGEERSPAAVHGSAGLSPVNRRAVGASVFAQLIGDAELVKKDGSIGIFLGNPLLKTQSGNEFACRVKGREGLYDRVEMSFMGVGISTSGDTPEMIVEAPCESLDESTRIAPIWVPVKQIFATPAADADFKTEGDHPVNIRVRNIPDDWPPQWVLSRVKLYRADDGEYFLEAGGADMKNARPSLLSFENN